MCDWRYGRYMEVYKGAWRCAEGHREVTEVHRCMWRCMEGLGLQRCMEVQGGARRWTEVCVNVWRGVWRSERCMELHVQVHEGGK